MAVNANASAMLELVARDAEPQLLVDNFEQPNGLCFSPDESLLYINDTAKAHIRVFDVATDGTIANRRVLADGIGSGDLNIGDLADAEKPKTQRARIFLEAQVRA